MHISYICMFLPIMLFQLSAILEIFHEFEDKIHESLRCVTYLPYERGVDYCIS